MTDRRNQSVISVYVFIFTDLTKATVSVEYPQGPYYPGDEVTLRCDITEFKGWDWYYWWYKGVDISQNKYDQYITIRLPDYAGQYQYTCQGNRGPRPTASQPSAPLTIILTGNDSCY